MGTLVGDRLWWPVAVLTVVSLAACGGAGDGAAAPPLPADLDDPDPRVAGRVRAAAEELEATLVVADLDGLPHSLLEGSDARAIVLLFAAVDCPVSNFFAPETERIHVGYGGRDVDFYLVFADGDTTREALRGHLEEFGYTMPALLDFDHVLVEYTGATVTPEAVVLSPEGELLYRGRIDDTYVDFGKRRAAPTRHDLREALDAILAGRRPPAARTEAIGCFID